MLARSLSPYDIVSLQPDESSAPHLIIRGKPSFFTNKNSSSVTCQYDFGSRQMTCRDLHCQYMVSVQLEMISSVSQANIMACLSLLTAKRICPNFPYCYGEFRHTLMMEKIDFNLNSLISSPSSQSVINPFVVASIMFQVGWSLIVANLLFGFQHHQLAKLCYIGLIPTDARGSNVLLTFRYPSHHGVQEFQIPTFGFLPKIITGEKARFQQYSNNADLSDVARSLLRLVHRKLDRTTPRREALSRQLVELLLRLQKEKQHNFTLRPETDMDTWFDFFYPIFGQLKRSSTATTTNSSLVFEFPKSRELGWNLVRQTVKDDLKQKASTGSM